MGFNRRKLEDQRREAANKEAAKRRATMRFCSVRCRVANHRAKA